MGFSTSYQLLDDGGVRLTIATIEGAALAVDFTAEDAVENVRAFARTLGLVVAVPL